jgi:hypothetical protein
MCDKKDDSRADRSVFRATVADLLARLTTHAGELVGRARSAPQSGHGNDRNMGDT